MKFIDVAHYFEQLDATASRTEMTKLLAALFSKATPTEASILCNLALGQLHPPYIGTQFNIATSLMTQTIAELLDLSVSTVQNHAKKLGDLGLVAAEGSWRAREALTIHKVYDALCELEEISGAGSQEEKVRLLKNLLQDLDPISAKYVVRIIIGKLRLGFSDMTIIDALSWMAAGDKSLRETIENGYNMCADIGIIAATLKEEGIKGIEKMHIKIGIPILPAAAERMPTAKAIIEKLGHCVAQPKLDGFRLQIHVDKAHKKPKVHFFSRNLHDMSAMFPDLVDAFASLDVDTLICEGEAIVYDPNTGAFSRFQETVKRKRKHGIEEAIVEMPLQVFVFDLLYVNGKDVLNLSHEERRAKLEKIFKHAKSDVVQVIEEKRIDTAKQLEDYFTANITAGLEGLVVKRPDAIYQPGKRNFNWIKLKRQEEGHLDDTLDCVVLGYYAGEGKRAAFGIGAFLVALFNKKEDRFETVAKIGTGLKDHDWIELKKKCDALASKVQPKNVVCNKDLYPDVWVAPSMVVIIRADEITLSPVHSAGKTADHAGYALRFPRFMGYRFDKSPEEATTVTEIVRLYKMQFEK